MADIFDQKSLNWAKVFGIATAAMPFVMLAINWVMSWVIKTTDISGVNVQFSVAQVNVRNAIASGGYQGQISDWLAGLFGYKIPELLANVPGATINIWGIPLTSVLAGLIVGAVGGFIAHKAIMAIGLPQWKGTALYIEYALVASLIGFAIVAWATGLPTYIGLFEILIAMLINALAIGFIAEWLAKNLKI